LALSFFRADDVEHSTPSGFMLLEAGGPDQSLAIERIAGKPEIIEHAC